MTNDDEDADADDGNCLATTSRDPRPFERHGNIDTIVDNNPGQRD